MRENLRRQALESGKTVSKKAQSKLSSRASSVATSRNASANVSANVSENGDGDDGDDSGSENSSYIGLEDLSLEPQDEDNLQTWTSEIHTMIEEITDRKRSSTQGREKSLASYDYIITHRYASAQIKTRLSDLVAAFLKSVKKEDSEKETILAIKALSLTIITCPENHIYEPVSTALKNAYASSQSIAVKAAAIHGRSITAAYGGESEDNDTEEIMNEYLEIIESDGNSIEAGDSHEVVLAALEAWGFLATLVDDLEDATQDAIEAFAEQLESSYPYVQIAAGENIALLFEKSYTETEHDDIDESGRKIDANKIPFVKRYEAYRQSNQLKHTLAGLLTERHRYLPKKEQKLLRSNFKDVLRGVENPTMGPRYKEDDLGSIKYSRVTIGKSGRSARGVVIDKWWKLLRLDGLRRLLGSGFLTHYQDNDVIEETLPSKQLEIVHTEKRVKEGRVRNDVDDDDE